MAQNLQVVHVVTDDTKEDENETKDSFINDNDSSSHLLPIVNFEEAPNESDYSMPLSVSDECHWVVPGLIIAGAYPNEETLYKLYDECNVNIFLSLTEDGVSYYPNFLRKNKNVKCIEFPIADQSIARDYHVIECIQNLTNLLLFPKNNNNNNNKTKKNKNKKDKKKEKNNKNKNKNNDNSNNKKNSNHNIFHFFSKNKEKKNKKTEKDIEKENKHDTNNINTNNTNNSNEDYIKMDNNNSNNNSSNSSSSTNDDKNEKKSQWRSFNDKPCLYIHCLGGHGRTGTITPLLLMALYNIKQDIARKWVLKCHTFRTSNKYKWYKHSDHCYMPERKSQLNQIAKLESEMHKIYQSNDKKLTKHK